MNQQPTPDDVLHHPERIPGYSYGNDATPSPLTARRLDGTQGRRRIDRRGRPSPSSGSGAAGTPGRRHGRGLANAGRPASVPRSLLGSPGWIAESRIRCRVDTSVRPVGHRCLHPPTRPSLARSTTRDRIAPQSGEEEPHGSRRLGRPHPAALPARIHRSRHHHRQDVPHRPESLRSSRSTTCTPRSRNRSCFT